MLDMQLLQRPPHLGQLRLVDLRARLRRDEVVASPVGVNDENRPCARIVSDSPRKLEAVPSSSHRKIEVIALVASSIVTIRSRSGPWPSHACFEPS